MENTKFKATNIIDLYSSTAMYTILKIMETRFPDFSKIKNNIFIKEVEVEKSSFMKLSLILFRYNDELQEDKKILGTFNRLYNNYVANYGEPDIKDIEYDEDMVISTPPAFINKEDGYTFKNLLIEEDLNEMFNTLILEWNNLSKEDKDDWILISFLSMNFILLRELLNKYENDVIDFLDDNSENKETFNLMFGEIVNMFNIANLLNEIFENENLNIGFEFFLFLTKNVKLDKYFSENLELNNLEFYNDIKTALNK